MDKALLLQKEIQAMFGDVPVNLVGGSVRDIILGKEPKDWDYCTPLTPDEIEQKVRDAGRKPYLTGKRFGTIGFKVPLSKYRTMLEDGTLSELQDSKINFVYVEVTTYRTEKYDGISRKPNVEFSDNLIQDLSRRDFTMNAIVLQEDSTYFDPFGGRLDILAKKIKAVGKGKDRILEDPLRMLRAARFASQTGFEIDPNLIGVMKQHASEITRVSKERWIAELDKLLNGEDVMSGIEVLYRTDLLKYILPELHTAIAMDNNFIIDITEGINEAKTLDEKWKVLLYPIGLPIAAEEKRGVIKYPKHEIIRKELLEGICARLKLSNDRKDILLK